MSRAIVGGMAAPSSLCTLLINWAYLHSQLGHAAVASSGTLAC